MGRDLRQRVLAAAEADLQPQLVRRQGECREGAFGILRAEAQTRQGLCEQALLSRTQAVPAGPAIEPLGRFSGRRQISAPPPDPSAPR